MLCNICWFYSEIFKDSAELNSYSATNCICLKLAKHSSDNTNMNYRRVLSVYITPGNILEGTSFNKKNNKITSYPLKDTVDWFVSSHFTFRIFAFIYKMIYITYIIFNFFDIKSIFLWICPSNCFCSLKAWNCLDSEWNG